MARCSINSQIPKFSTAGTEERSETRDERLRSDARLIPVATARLKNFAVRFDRLAVDCFATSQSRNELAIRSTVSLDRERDFRREP